MARQYREYPESKGSGGGWLWWLVVLFFIPAVIVNAQGEKILTQQQKEFLAAMVAAQDNILEGVDTFREQLRLIDQNIEKAKANRQWDEVWELERNRVIHLELIKNTNDEFRLLEEARAYFSTIDDPPSNSEKELAKVNSRLERLRQADEAIGKKIEAAEKSRNRVAYDEAVLDRGDNHTRRAEYDGIKQALEDLQARNPAEQADRYFRNRLSRIMKKPEKYKWLLVKLKASASPQLRGFADLIKKGGGTILRSIPYLDIIMAPVRVLGEIKDKEKMKDILALLEQYHFQFKRIEERYGDLAAGAYWDVFIKPLIESRFEFADKLIKDHNLHLLGDYLGSLREDSADRLEKIREKLRPKETYYEQVREYNSEAAERFRKKQMRDLEQQQRREELWREFLLEISPPGTPGKPRPMACDLNKKTGLVTSPAARPSLADTQSISQFFSMENLS